MNIFSKRSVFKTIYNCFSDPLYISKSKRSEQVERYLNTAHGRVLDIGCGKRQYEKKLNGLVTDYIGLDYPDTLSSDIEPDIYSNALSLPVKNDSIDTVLCFEVLNYLSEPLVLFKEVHRVLRAGGLFLLSGPLIRGNGNESNDFFRITSFGLKFLAEKVNLEVINITSCGGLWAMTGQRVSSAIAQRFRNSKFKKLNTAMMCGPTQCIGLALDKLWFWPHETLHLFMGGKKPN